MAYLIHNATECRNLRAGTWAPIADSDRGISGADEASVPATSTDRSLCSQSNSQAELPRVPAPLGLRHLSVLPTFVAIKINPVISFFAGRLKECGEKYRNRGGGDTGRLVLVYRVAESGYFLVQPLDWSDTRHGCDPRSRRGRHSRARRREAA
jgi:hypothetical protein